MSRCATTAGALAEMRNEIGSATGDFAGAQSSLEALTASGKFTADSLASAGQAAVSLAQLTGRSIEDTTNQVIGLAKSPTASLLELNERYHFLTLEVYENVKSLEEQGRAQDATKVATDALAAATSSRVAQMRENAGTLERAWYDVRDAVRGTWQAIKDIGRDDAEARIAAGERGIRMANQQRAELQEQVRLGILTQAQADRANQALRERIANEQKNIAQWRERKDLQDQTAKAAAEEQQLQDKAVGAAASIDRDIARIDKKAERQQRLNRLIEQYNVIAAVDPNDSFDAGEGYAEGGWTGPGSKWQPAGIVHAEEFVARREVVRQPGARSFLEDFNERGMDALQAWRGYADGGFVTADPDLAGPRWDRHPSVENGALAPTVNANTRVLNLLDMDQLAQALANNREFEKTLVNGVVANGNSIRAGWQE